MSLARSILAFCSTESLPVSPPSLKFVESELVLLLPDNQPNWPLTISRRYEFVGNLDVKFWFCDKLLSLIWRTSEVL